MNFQYHMTKKESQQHLHFLQSSPPPSYSQHLLKQTINSILFRCLTICYGNCTDCRTLQRIVRTAEKIIRVSLPTTDTSFNKRCIHKPPAWWINCLMKFPPSHYQVECIKLPELSPPSDSATAFLRHWWNLTTPMPPNTHPNKSKPFSSYSCTSITAPLHFIMLLLDTLSLWLSMYYYEFFIDATTFDCYHSQHL